MSSKDNSYVYMLNLASGVKNLVTGAADHGIELGYTDIVPVEAAIETRSKEKLLSQSAKNKSK